MINSSLPISIETNKLSLSQKPSWLLDLISQIRLPSSDSHKGQNGKVMIVGGSQLFHSASRWSLEVASRIVDMVFYASTPENNRLISEAKAQFHNGIVISREEIRNYIDEADAVLIGPGMERSHETQNLTNQLLESYPNKKWVIDAGALQMVDVRFIGKNTILTPHAKEFDQLMKKTAKYWYEKFGKKRVEKDGRKLVSIEIPRGFSIQLEVDDFNEVKEDWLFDQPRHYSWIDRYFNELNQGIANAQDSLANPSGDMKVANYALGQPTILLKGKNDEIVKLTTQEPAYYDYALVSGGSPGMTKGGTGDVLAGLVAGLYALSDHPFAVALLSSIINKKAGEELSREVGPFFSSSDLSNQIPKTMKKVFF